MPVASRLLYLRVRAAAEASCANDDEPRWNTTTAAVGCNRKSIYLYRVYIYARSWAAATHARTNERTLVTAARVS